MDQLQPSPDRVQNNLPRPTVKIILTLIILTLIILTLIILTLIILTLIILTRQTKTAILCLAAIVLICGAPQLGSAAEPKPESIDIGSRREMFVDDYLIGRIEKARRVLHHPTPREISLVRNKPWEGNASGYTTVLQDGDLYRVYQHWGIVETRSHLQGAPNELSFYVSEAGRQENGNRLRRYTLRIDGFVSVNAPLAGGELVTKPLRFEGNQLEINFSTSAAGSVRVEIQDANGDPIPGFTLADCNEQFGDEIDRVVSWKQGTDVSGLSDKTVRLRFEPKDADLYSFQFAEKTKP